MNILYIFSVLLLLISPIYTFTLRNNLHNLNESINTNSIQQKLIIRSHEEKSNSSNSECKNNLKEFDECLDVPEDDVYIDLESFCEGYHSEKCKDFINGGLPSVRGCSNDLKDEKEFKIYYVVSELMKLIYKLHCTKDENNNYCPISIMDSENRQFVKKYGNQKLKPVEETEQEFYTFINNTCILKDCRESIINIDEDYEYLDELLEKYDELNNKTHTKRAFYLENFEKTPSDDLMKKAAEYLKSEECIHMIEIQNNEKSIKSKGEKDEDSDDDSSSNTIKYHINTIILSLLLLFIILN